MLHVNLQKIPVPGSFGFADIGNNAQGTYGGPENPKRLFYGT